MRGKKLTSEQFVAQAKEIHGDVYDYALVRYKNMHTKVQIICKVHGMFEQDPASHISRNFSGCIFCAKEIARTQNKISVEDFVKKARKVHGDKYDYSKVVYINNYTTVEIVCPMHGSFFQLPTSHIGEKHECNACSNSRKGPKTSRSPNKEASLYLVKIFDDREEFLKVGITTRLIKTRLKAHISPYQFDVVEVRNMKGKEAFQKEQAILKEFEQERYIPMIKFDGYTECFKYSPQNVERIQL